MSNYYTDEIIEEVRINNDIENVVSEYVKLERKGRDYFGLCPFHKEKTPSFSVVPSKQIFYCFGCGKGGNVIHFIMNVENLSYIDSIKHLADRARIQLPEGESEEERERGRVKQELLKINTEAARFFYAQLNDTTHKRAREYLKGRKISENTLKRFGIGYSPEQWDILYRHLLGKGFSEENILKSGLVIQKNNGTCYDRFKGRIIFPIFDVRGNVIGFGGRVLDNSMPKYMNSPETLVYNKGRQLYGLNFAKHSGSKRILVVEGYLDVISLHQCGIINTTASLGTALTESQGRLLKKYAEEIIISYDADTAGQAATMRGLDLLSDIGCNVKVLLIPEGKDPDEFVKKSGADAFTRLIDNSLSLIEYKIKVLKNQINLDTTEGKIKFLTNVASLLSKVNNHVEREMYIKKLAAEYGIREEALFSQVLKNIKPQVNFKSANIKKPMEKSAIQKAVPVDDKLLYYERLVLALIIIDNSAFKTARDKFLPKDYTGDINTRAAEIVYTRLENNKGIVPGELFSILDENTASLFAKLIQEECNYEDSKKAVLDIIRKITLIKLEKRQQEIFDILNKKEHLSEGDVEKLKLELKTIILQKKNM